MARLTLMLFHDDRASRSQAERDRRQQDSANREGKAPMQGPFPFESAELTDSKHPRVRAGQGADQNLTTAAPGGD